MYLKLQYFKSVIDYNFELHHITSIIESHGNKVINVGKIEKRLSTFHAKKLTVQTRGQIDFKKFAYLIIKLMRQEEHKKYGEKQHIMTH